MRLLFALTFLIFTKATHAQFDFKNDTSCYPPYNDWLNKIDSVYHLSKYNDFEIRIWIHPARAYWPIMCTLGFKKSEWMTNLFYFTGTPDAPVSKKKF